MGYPKIVLLGDSITNSSFYPGGYGTHLSQAVGQSAESLWSQYAGKADVLNRGMPGYNSKQILAKLEGGLEVGDRADVRLVILNAGTNDCVLSGPGHVSLDQYRSNLHQLIRLCRQEYAHSKILLLSPGGYSQKGADAFQAYMGGDLPSIPRDDRLHATYARAAIEVGTSEQVATLDVYALLQSEVESGLDYQSLLPDGLHYSTKGYKPINRSILGVIESHYPDLSPSALPTMFESCMTFARDNETPEIQAQLRELQERLKDRIKTSEKKAKAFLDQIEV